MEKNYIISKCDDSEFCFPPIPVSRVLHQDRHEGSFQDKCRSFVRRKKMYMDCHNDIRDVLTCRQDCIPISFLDIQTSW